MAQVFRRLDGREYSFLSVAELHDFIQKSNRDQFIANRKLAHALDRDLNRLPLWTSMNPNVWSFNFSSKGV